MNLVKRIGTLTLPLHHNYGGILQAYALQTFLKQLGYEVYFINLVKPKPKIQLKKRIFPWILENVVEFNTRNFSKEFVVPVTRTVDNLDELEKVVKEYSLDAVIVGSDQVWRLEYSKQIALNLFLDFVNTPNVKKLSYAASFGVDEWKHPEGITNEIKCLLQKMDAVSVREDSGIELCKEIFDVDAVQMIDPTLLLSQDDYGKVLTESSAKAANKMLTVYILDKSKDKMDVVKKVALRTGLMPVFTNVNKKFAKKRHILNIKPYMYPKVTDWIKGFRDAQYVVTDSFHGVAFSLIFNKPFIAIGNKGRGLARFQSILKIFKLSDRLIFTSDEVTDELIDRKINFDEVNEIKNLMRSKAVEFISSNLHIKNGVS